MNKKDLIQKIIYLPKLYIEQNGSLCDFLKKISYFEFYDQITEKDIEDSLTKNPECINLWLQYSTMQRTSLAWQFVQLGDNTYEVSFPNRDKAEFTHKFTDANKACVSYIGTVLGRMKGDYLLEKIGFPKIIGNFKKKKIINAIAYMPKLLTDLRYVSNCEFSKRVGYFKFHDRISERDFEDFLRKNPECIKLWLQYSEDQRVVESWYFLKSIKGAYEVAHNSKVGTDSLHEFLKPDKACAFFMKKILENTRRICSSHD